MDYYIVFQYFNNIYKINQFIYIAFFGDFEESIKIGCLKAESLMNLESNKIKIIKTLIDNMNSETLKFIRCYAMRVYNDCNLLTYSRGMKDTDNNYYLLRIKDFLSDLFFCIFSGKNKDNIELITIQDIFITMHLITETGKVWISIKNYDNRNDIAKKIECILNYLKVKPSDMCIFVNQDLEYYNYLIDYFDFYLDKFIKEIQSEEKMDITEKNNIENINIENKKNILEKENDNDNKNIIIDTNKENNNSINILSQNDNNSKKERNNPTKSKKIKSNNNNIINTNNINSNIEEKAQNLLDILFLLNNVYFRGDHEKTKHLILNIIKIINDLGEEDIEKQIEVLNAFYNLKHKENLNKKIINEIQILYINSLIQQNKLNEADLVIQNSLRTILPNTKEEVIYFILNFYLLLQQKNCEPTKLGEMFEIVIQHQELKIEDLNEIFIHIYNHEYKFYLLKLFCEEICYNSNNVGQNRNKNKNDINNRNNADNNKYLNSKIELNFNILTSMPEFVLIFNYLFLDAFIYAQEAELNINDDKEFSITMKDIEKIINNENFFELMKVMSEALLENSINNLYNEHKMNIPTLLHNLIYLFLNKVKNVHQSNFANYFLIDIINKFKKNNIEKWKDFSLMSIELYIEKKDYNKLKSILKELETDEKEAKHSTFIFAKIISILGEGIKWNSINSIEQLCQDLNDADDFEILYYIKIFRFIYDNRINDIFLLSIILEKYYTKNIEIYNNFDCDNNPLNNLKYVNYNYSMIDCCYEVLFYSSHFNNFCSKIDAFCDILENICIFMENFKYDSNLKNKIIITNVSVVSELIKLFISFKNLKDFKSGKYYYPDYMISNISKLLNFIFLNFEQFFSKEYLQNINTQISYESLIPVTMLFSFFQNAKIFSFSSEIKELVNEKMKEKDITNKYISLKDKYKLYQQNFVNAIKIYTNIIQEYDNNNMMKKNNNSNNSNKSNNNRIIIEENNLIKPKINQYLTNIYNETKIYDEIIMIKLTINAEKDNLKNYITNIINKNYNDKKFMMIVNSVLFCEGFKNLCFYLINELINKIIVTNREELFNKSYTTNDIFELYKELYNVSDENDIQIQIKSLKNYQIFLCKLFGKIDDSVFYQNTEWIYYQVFQMLERGGVNLDKKTMNFTNLKSIFDEINNVLIGKEKTLIIEGLIDLIIKKTI